jgi:hypothetical protein
MRVLLAIVGLALVPFWSDLSQVDRTVNKQPVYKGKPRYCLLAFGPEAKTRVWVVLDGTDLYVDRNGDGELTDDERFSDDGRKLEPFEIADPSTKDRYKVTSMAVHRSDKEKRVFVMANVEVVGKYKQYCDLTPVETQKEAPVAHFHGPLQIGLREANWVCNERLVRGEPPGELFAWVGTFDKANGCWVVLCNTVDEHRKDLPGDFHPVADIEYPPVRPGEKSIRQRCELKQRC